MKNAFSIRFTIAVATAVSCFPSTPLARADDSSDLLDLVRSTGEDYVQLRNAMLERHPEPWEVTVAAERSWETGIAAFVLNQRLAAPWSFVRWDNLHPRSDIIAFRFTVYDDIKISSRDTDRRAATAFLLAKMWKAPGEQKDRRWAATPEQESKAAYNTLSRIRIAGILKGTAVTALWKAIWEQSEDERFRYIAIGPLCADPDPSVQANIVDFLHALDDKLAGYSAKPRCLSGLWHRDTEETVDAILGALDVLRNEDRLGDAVGALAANGSPRARAFVHAFILNTENDETLRGEALAKFCNHPHPDDIEVIRRFMAGPASVRVKTAALRSIGGNCPLEYFRPALLEILTQSDDREMIANAALALANGYSRTKSIGDAAVVEDIALLDRLARREDLSAATRVHIDKYITQIREKRSRLSAQPDGR